MAAAVSTDSDPAGLIVSSASILETVRRHCLGKGDRGIHDLGVLFRHLDVDYNKRIVYEEMRDKFHDFGLKLSDENVRVIFRAMDVDESGGIDFVELMCSLRPPMAECRIQVINEAFTSLDSNCDGAIGLDEIRVVYAANARRHPKYVSGEWTEEQTLRHFLDSLDTPGSPDGKVTRQEFLNYYAGVSATVDDDCYFDLVMRSVYGLPPASCSS